MFDYALKNDRYIGMVQPSEYQKHSGKEKVHLFNIGCAGLLQHSLRLMIKGMKLYLKEFVGSKLRKS